jgi:hypothetical protein
MPLLRQAAQAEIQAALTSDALALAARAIALLRSLEKLKPLDRYVMTGAAR